MKWLCCLLPLLLLSCADEQAWSPPAQAWQDMHIRVESRPVVPRRGSNEFLVIASHQQRGFINDLLVHVRSDHSDWKQAIPDGALGVFRRALPVADPATDHLHVRLQRKDKEGELIFSLAMQPKP